VSKPSTSHARLRALTGGQRVKVAEAVSAVDSGSVVVLNAFGTVRRVRRDGGAWVALDQRSRVKAVHPWPPSDDRNSHVLAYPEHCEAPPADNRSAGNRKERRAGKLLAKEAAEPTPTLADFGRDHWSTFAYLEIRCVDHGGVPKKENMRCLDGRHTFQAHGHDATGSPTRLRGDRVIHHHDDWDCLDDLEQEGLIESLGTAVSPRYRLTDRGREIASQLRAHKADGGSFSTFTTTEVRP
jgi:hypothetical protein